MFVLRLVLGLVVGMIMARPRATLPSLPPESTPTPDHAGCGGAEDAPRYLPPLPPSPPPSPDHAGCGGSDAERYLPAPRVTADEVREPVIGTAYKPPGWYEQHQLPATEAQKLQSEPPELLRYEPGPDSGSTVTDALYRPQLDGRRTETLLHVQEPRDPGTPPLLA